MKIQIQTATLTDGSQVHDVMLIQDDDIVCLPAYDRASAELLVDVIYAAINERTTEIVVKVF